MAGSHDPSASDTYSRILKHPALERFKKNAEKVRNVEPTTRFETRAEYMRRIRREIFKAPEPPPPPPDHEMTPFGPAYYVEPWWKEHEVSQQD